MKLIIFVVHVSKDIMFSTRLVNPVAITAQFVLLLMFVPCALMDSIWIREIICVLDVLKIVYYVAVRQYVRYVRMVIFIIL